MKAHLYLLGIVLLLSMCGSGQSTFRKRKSPIRQMMRPIHYVMRPIHHGMRAIMSPLEYMGNSLMKEVHHMTSGNNIGHSHYGAPKPSYKAHKPTYGAPKPGYNAPKPSYDAPAPTYHVSKPSYGPAKPTYVTPTSNYHSSEPSYEAAKPVYGSSQPIYHVPETHDEPIYKAPVNSEFHSNSIETHKPAPSVLTYYKPIDRPAHPSTSPAYIAPTYVSSSSFKSPGSHSSSSSFAKSHGSSFATSNDIDSYGSPHGSPLLAKA